MKIRFLFLCIFSPFLSRSSSEKLGLGAHKNRFKKGEIREWFSKKKGWKIEYLGLYDYLPRYLPFFFSGINNLLFSLTFCFDKFLRLFASSKENRSPLCYNRQESLNIAFCGFSLERNLKE